MVLVDDLRVRHDLIIPAAELSASASRSGGPGGQHVNKTATRVSLRWSVRHSAVLTEPQRQRLLHELDKRLTSEGELVIHAGDTPSQSTNLTLARERLAALVERALHRPRPRRPTRPSRAARMRRLDGKRRRGDLKRTRSRVKEDS